MGEDLQIWIIIATVIGLMVTMLMRMWGKFLLVLIVGGFLSVAVLDPIGTLAPIYETFKATLTS